MEAFWFLIGLLVLAAPRKVSARERRMAEALESTRSALLHIEQRAEEAHAKVRQERERYLGLRSTPNEGSAELLLADVQSNVASALAEVEAALG